MGQTDVYGETRSTQGGLTYPNPFLDLSSTYVPKDIKKLFTLARHFYLKNDLLHTIINKLTEYPITDLLFESTEDGVKLDLDTKDNYREAFYHTWKIKRLLVEIGMDYHVFGNCFLSINRSFERYLRCPSCKETRRASTYTDKELKFDAFRYQGVCKSCGVRSVFEVKDQYRKNKDNLHFVRWAPENIDLVHDSLTGTSEYYLLMDKQTQDAVRTGVRRTVDKLPWLYIQSLKKKKKIKLDQKNLYHFKQPGLAENWSAAGWGKPSILPAMSLIWYMQTLRRANEAIASEHIVPHRIVFPAPSGTMDPYTSLNLGRWRSEIRTQLEKWKTDPNYVGILPIPMGYQKLGGDAKTTLVTPEIKAIEESIARSLGVPWEFIAGGATWTGSSVSLRIIENHFLSYREMLVDFLNFFLIPRIKVATGWTGVKVKFKDFRMSDDTETKTLMANLNAAGKLSDSGLLDRFGIDADADRAAKIEDAMFEGKLIQVRMKAQNKANIEALEAQQRGQARAEWGYLDEKAKITEKEFEEDLARELEQLLGGTVGDTSSVLQKYAIQVFYASPNYQNKLLTTLAKKAPTVYQAIMIRLPLLQAAMIPSAEGLVGGAVQLEDGTEEEANSSSSPSSSSISKPKKEKTKGQSSGTP